MFKWLLLFLSPYVVAHQLHNSFGVHGLVLMQVEHKIIASHLPMPDGVHARQLVFEVGAVRQHEQVASLLRSEHLVTFAPEPFELDKLRRGDITELTGSLYRGHFERAGTMVEQGLSLKVKEIILDKPIVLADNGHFYMKPVTEQSCLLVHKIGRLPSFDQIVQVNCLGQIDSSKLVESELKTPLIGTELEPFTFVQSLYLETQDFAGH
ncbi:hypothetical protein L1285_13875 [Pseudoalteromonas sp. DL2-H2.2]|uniref:hypothetical protein n=1 Tax=Pseudoalteromonas sp. DL2-H2.2 TaxID=2908889 RepID=UPI001F264880|nr:hypothetical protein [Pseudoalteromonas sp. DL2-H2.2]MCF2909408.1 hypothetical protein [Pseudoalteromonas sp. DL2-H2.2]